MSLFLLQWNIHECSAKFNDIAQKIFSAPSKQSTGLWGKFRLGMRTWLADGVYDAVNFEEQLRITFGERKMFDTFGNNSSGSKVAVVATSIDHSTPHLFSSYNAHDDITGMSISLIPSIY